MAVLNNLTIEFKFKLLCTLQDKLKFSPVSHNPDCIFFQHLTSNYYLASLTLVKPAIYYEFSKKIAEGGFSRICIKLGRRDIVRGQYGPEIHKTGSDWLGIYPSDDDFLASYESKIEYLFLYDMLYQPSAPGLGCSLFPCVEFNVTPSFEEDEDEDEESSLTCINGIQTYKIEECLICTTEKPNILFCNCGHIPTCICDDCDNEKPLEKSPICKTKIDIKRKI